MTYNFGELLKKYRNECNYSQQQLAEKVQVDRTTVANWENGRRVPDLIVLSKIAEVFNVDISVFTSSLDSSHSQPNVIIVDDEKILVEGTKIVLKEAMPGANIVGFSRVSEAIEYSGQNKVSIAFLDIELGKVSGFSLCESLLEINPLINIIFLTSHPQYAYDAWNTKASGFLTKPLHLSDVKSQLSKLRHPVTGLL